MKPEDQKRLQREADIAKSVRGPDYARLETEIGKAKAQAALNEQSGRLEDAVRARIVSARRSAEAAFVPQITVSKSSQDKDFAQGD